MPRPSKDQKCEHCQAFSEGKGDRGTCHMAPPLVGPAGNAGWPIINKANWCMQFVQVVRPEEPPPGRRVSLE